MLLAVPARIVFRGFHIAGVEVLDFFSSNIGKLLPGNLADLDFRYGPASRDDSGGLFEEVATVGTLGFQFERPVAVDLDDNGNAHTKVGFRALIELLDELAEVEAVLTERRTDRRGGGRLTTFGVKTDRCD